MASNKTKFILAGAALTLVAIHTDLVSVPSVFASDNQTGVKHLSLNTDDITTLIAKTGAGKLHINGVTNTDVIEVEAEVFAPKVDASDIELELVKKGGAAYFVAKIDSNNNWGFDESPYIDVTISVPEHLMMDIKDGSGEINIKGMKNNIELVDGSGSITIDGAKGLDITDGSGSMTLSQIDGHVTLTDGSGSIDLTHVEGNVKITDGSGSIMVKHVNGTVTIDDGSGGIDVEHANGLTIGSAGSGKVHYAHINGPVNL